ncbi:MAG: VTT domain-containing protein [Actinomycetota bacterium]|nr:VTT domain-containing protein [Actinomycetota bacterium]
MQQLGFILLDPEELLTTLGLIGLFAVLFTESGILAGFFLPGNSLLLTAGLLAAQDELPLGISAVVAVCISAAVLGNQLGFSVGRRWGPHLFERPSSRFFRPDHVAIARTFFERHGGATIVLARFVPVVRTFAPALAGTSGMHGGRFVGFNVIGGILWGASVPVAGYLVGDTIPGLERWLVPAAMVLVTASLVPVVRELRRFEPAVDPAIAADAPLPDDDPDGSR